MHGKNKESLMCKSHGISKHNCLLDFRKVLHVAPLFKWCSGGAHGERVHLWRPQLQMTAKPILAFILQLNVA